MKRLLWKRFGVVLAGWAGILSASGAEPARDVDASSLRHKVLCGYQGWFRAPGDPADQGWRHWSRYASRITPESLTFEMWPDMSEAAPDEKYPAPGFTHPDGTPAYLFSSANPRTVDRHFDWMTQYGIDGVFVQRFLVSLKEPSLNQVLGHVRAAAARTGRVYAICYDLTGMREDRLYDLLAADWKRQVDELKTTRDERYLHHDHRPVVFVWGFFPERFGPATAHRIIDLFRSDRRYQAVLIGGVPWYWRGEGAKNAEWARAFRRFDVISPWNVGHTTLIEGRKQAAVASWKEESAAAREAGSAFLPVVYPGFGWTHLKGPQSAKATVPRLGGAFFWRQFVAAAELGLDMVYVAMFDEVDEATAVFKVTNSPPVQAKFATFDGLPADWYLRLTGEGTKLIQGRIKPTDALPIQP